jgi:hypothetical protein
MVTKFPLTFGQHREITPRDADISSYLSFEFRPVDIMTKWQRCSLTADFIAQFELGMNTHPDNLNILSSIINELLENIIKFAKDKTETVCLRIAGAGDTLLLETINSADQTDATHFIDFLDEFFIPDFNPDTFFATQIEKSSNVGYAEGSQLGLYTIRHHYNAEIGVNIQKDKSSPETFRVDVSIKTKKERTDEEAQ